MEEWKEYKLEETTDFIAGYAFKSKDFGSYENKVVKIKDIQPPFVSIASIDGVNIHEYDISKLAKYLVYKNDFLLAMTGATIGKIGRYIYDKPVYLNQRVLKFMPKVGFDSDFIYYSLISDSFQKFIINHIDSDSAQPNISANTIGKYRLYIPDITIQKKISHVLKVLDSKIELNRRINDNLEQQAQALFKSWFVENASYSGVSISEYFLPNRGKNLLVSDAKGGITPVVAGGLTPSAFHNVANTKAPVITISASGANAGFVNLWGIPVWAADSSYIDSTIVSNIYFWYNLLKYNQKNIYESQTGSAQPHIYPKHIGNLLIPDLDMRKVECYESIVTSMYLQINEIQQETKFLSDLRDTLLPKLMSGELKINDLNC